MNIAGQRGKFSRQMTSARRREVWDDATPMICNACYKAGHSELTEPHSPKICKKIWSVGGAKYQKCVCKCQRS